MKPWSEGGAVTFGRTADLGGLEFLRAVDRRHPFVRHSHDTYSIGLVEGGANGFFCRGRNEVAPAGAICLVNPGEVHTGGEAGWWTYWNLYPSPEHFEAVTAGLRERRAGSPVFPRAVIHDPQAAGLLHALFLSLVSPSSLLERETHLLRALGHLLRRHAESPPRAPQGRPEPAAVARAREYLEGNVAANVSLTELGAVAGLSPFHLLRLFRRTLGLPPHAYQVQLRVRRAKNLVFGGMSLAEAALESGFSDQAHLTRRFKAMLGVTPGRLRERSSFVQDPPAGDRAS